MTKWVNIGSTAIRRIGYDSDTSRLYIDFEDSAPIYTFCRVPAATFEAFIRAPSKGSFYHQNIKDRYQC
ncbi:hypothetical protein CF98_24540 [Halopseudomonas bauzanensis]|nr:hypothetical protein CF98_24540 [Halopseudomonas bauzanensis]